MGQGAILDCVFKKFNPFLATADVWMDAMVLSETNGMSLASVPNLGRSGGSFTAFTSGTVPGLPTFVTNAINGKVALDFNGPQP